jgi:hypothetical protein
MRAAAVLADVRVTRHGSAVVIGWERGEYGGNFASLAPLDAEDNWRFVFILFEGHDTSSAALRANKPARMDSLNWSNVSVQVVALRRWNSFSEPRMVKPKCFGSVSLP